MKILFIGGTGNISTAVSRLCIEKGIELYLLNRGKRAIEIHGSHSIIADIHDEKSTANTLHDQTFDSVVDWIAFTPSDIERDIRLFTKRTRQFIFISSASAYEKPPQNPIITESTPLINPYWDYSRNKIACENLLMESFRKTEFPVTIVRPSLTYDTVVPVAIGGWGCYTFIDRIKKHGTAIIHGDGSSLWTITHSKDFAKGFVGLLGNPKSIGEAYHITSDEILTWNQIYQYIANAIGVELKSIHIPSDFITQIVPDMTGTLLGDKTWSAIFDNSKIKSLVPDFKATISFKDGIKQTIAWFEADPKRQRVDQKVNEMMDRIIREYKKS
jgi:nucleoside-diphosphate-sugar epimerase